jgi:hypothetical protein
MARGLTSFSIVLLLAAGVPGLRQAAFGQIIIPGVGYPRGGGYPGQRYPQQGGQGGPGQGRQSNEAATLTGILRRIDEKSVVIEDDDKTITTVAIHGSTKYIGPSGGSAKIGDFQPGDHVSIAATQDNKKAYKASAMTLVREGTAEEHSVASLAADDTSHPLPNRPDSPSSSGSSSSASNSSGSSSGGRPSLRKATPAPDDSSASSGSSRSSSSSSDDNDPDRPRLRRAPSTASDTSASSANSSSGNSPAASSSSSDSSAYGPTPRARRAVSSSDDSTPKAEIGPGDSASTSAPPQLRRASPSTDSDAVVADARPSLHAGDVNGVTRAPAPPQAGAPDATRSGGITASGDDFIDQAREEALSFSETLPNYVVKQYTTRYASAVVRGGKTSWQALDTVTADVIEEDGNEKYKNILVNGKTPLRDPEKTGSWSRGEFSSLQLDVLSPLTNADFHGKRATTIANHAAFRYDFSVDEPNSHWHMESEGQTCQPAYTGSIWIDKQNYRVLRIEVSAVNMPRNFPLDQVESAVDYDYVVIGDGKYLLPVHSEALSCSRGRGGCTRNVIEFRNYKKFTADTSITFEADK